MGLYDVFQALELTPVGVAIRQSVWLFPVIEAAHLLALAMLGGAVIVLDLRLLGLGLTGQPASVIERASRPWLIGGIVAMMATGTPLALSEALKLYGKDAFFVKMGAFAAAVAVSFALVAPLARRDRSGPLPKAAALLSLALWLTVAIAGRWIGFS